MGEKTTWIEILEQHQKLTPELVQVARDLRSLSPPVEGDVEIYRRLQRRHRKGIVCFEGMVLLWRNGSTTPAGRVDLEETEKISLPPSD